MFKVRTRCLITAAGSYFFSWALAPSCFVGFCRVLSVISDKVRLYNQAMQILEPYIPKEYLALKINYLRQQLAALPEVTKTKRVIRGKVKDIFVIDSHIIRVEGTRGKELSEIQQQCEPCVLNFFFVYNSKFPNKHKYTYKQLLYTQSAILSGDKENEQRI